MAYLFTIIYSNKYVSYQLDTFDIMLEVLLILYLNNILDNFSKILGSFHHFRLHLVPQIFFKSGLWLLKEVLEVRWVWWPTVLFPLIGIFFWEFTRLIRMIWWKLSSEFFKRQYIWLESFNYIAKIFVEAVLDKWRQLMSMMSLSGGKN